MSKKRKRYSSEFKAKVALAAIRGKETIPQLAARHGLQQKYFLKIKALQRQKQVLRMICIASLGN